MEGDKSGLSVSFQLLIKVVGRDLLITMTQRYISNNLKVISLGGVQTKRENTRCLLVI